MSQTVLLASQTFQQQNEMKVSSVHLEIFPKEKNVLWALAIFSVIAFVGVRFGVHLVPKYLEAVVGSKGTKHTSIEMFLEEPHVCVHSFCI